ncbi:MAG: hypothetical protein PVI40_08630 [Chlamydiota bacterium]|jgi:hypothetical protein
MTNPISSQSFDSSNSTKSDNEPTLKSASEACHCICLSNLSIQKTALFSACESAGGQLSTYHWSNESEKKQQSSKFSNCMQSCLERAMQELGQRKSSE